MNEDQLVAIRIAEIERHRFGAARQVELDVLVGQKRDRTAFRIVLVGGLELVAIKAVRLQLAFNPSPRGRGMSVIKV